MENEKQSNEKIFQNLGLEIDGQKQDVLVEAVEILYRSVKERKCKEYLEQIQNGKPKT